MAVTAIVISYNNQPYYYDQGVYYVQANSGYTVVPPPVNITIVELPKEGVENIQLDDTVYYYFGVIFYTKSNTGFTVIEAPDGAVVTNIPEGGTEEEIEGNTYVVFNDTYFQPLTQDGKDVYQVVKMEPTN